MTKPSPSGPPIVTVAYDGPRWQYLVEHISLEGTGGSELEKMNVLGQQGWQVIWCQPDGSMLLMRPLPPELHGLDPVSVFHHDQRPSHAHRDQIEEWRAAYDFGPRHDPASGA
jgi:hypothetical protein